MLTAHQIKVFQSLDKKKFREKHHLFLVEGNKNISEIHKSRYKIKDLFSINPIELSFLGVNCTEISEKDLKKISFLQNPKDSVAVCEILQAKKLKENGIQLLLDGIQDPGNLGTIIRLADWFGIEQIICSEDTVDCYNPKVIQASMGSFSRVNIVYENLEKTISETAFPTFGTAMEGENLYKIHFPTNFNIVLGNEGNGIRKEIFDLISHNISIPRFGKFQATESLNVSLAAGIILGQVFSSK